MIVKDIEVLLVALFALFMFTDFFIPLLRGKKLFPSFRKAEVKLEPKLDEKVAEAKAKIEEVKKVVEEANAEFNKAKDLKASADNILKP
jgi:hypothetical protein